MPDLFLHIGTHKTGTTSIQRFCSSNRDQLRTRGVWYPPAELGRFPSHYAHHRIAHAIAGRDSKAGLDDARDFFEKLSKRAKADEKCLISAEPLYRHVLHEPDPDGGRKAASPEDREQRYRRYIEAVKSCLGDFDVTIMVMLRRQDLFVESLYAEQVLATGYDRPIERFVTERQPLLDYESRLGAWADAFGEDRISVKVFEKSALVAPIEQIFVEWLGIEWDDGLTIGEQHNVTPSRTFVEFKRMMNTFGQDLAVSNQFRRWVEQLAATVDSDIVPPLGRYYLQPRDRVEILNTAAAGNRVVAERFCGRDELFADDVSADIAKYADRGGLSNAHYKKLSKELFRMIADGSVN